MLSQVVTGNLTGHVNLVDKQLHDPLGMRIIWNLHDTR
jgi:hypothetical protein